MPPILCQLVKDLYLEKQAELEVNEADQVLRIMEYVIFVSNNVELKISTQNIFKKCWKRWSLKSKGSILKRFSDELYYYKVYNKYCI